MRIKVGPEGDYTTISEAIEAAGYETETVIEIAAGVYKEKLFIEKSNITLIGSGRRRTIIEYGDGAEETMPDGTRRGTFRSQTVFLGGKRCVVKDMTIRNTAGSGDTAGQALALYADASKVVMENVELSSHQDTLFMAPLPIKTRHPGGFMGPRFLADRKPTRQYYRNCIIRGDVDFIFGGADAVFDDCEIIVCDRGRDINGYVVAPCENPGEIGFVFRHCVVRGELSDMNGTVLLGRPWRPTGRAVYAECRYDESIHPLRFSEWGQLEADESEAFFAEYKPTDLNGEPIDISGKNGFVKLLDDAEYEKIRTGADKLVNDLWSQEE
ncbi:MAG: pectin esterase [Lachnospiraceae bacterium]|nr:pectin esterase [Lachnospiraceae bacterium]